MQRLQSGLLKMPRVVLTAAEEDAADKAGGTDLRYQEVRLEDQRIFYHIGVTTVEKLANLAKDREDLVGVLKEHWALDQDNSLQERVRVAAIVCAHSNAKARAQRSAEADAEFETQEWTKPVVAGEWFAMKTALERRLGALEDKVAPAKEYVEKKLAEVEAGEYRAEDLAEVISRDEVDPDSVVPVWDSKGRLTMRRGSTKVTSFYEEDCMANELD